MISNILKIIIVTLDNGRQYFPFGYDEIVEKVVLTEQFDIPEQLLKKSGNYTTFKVMG